MKKKVYKIIANRNGHGFRIGDEVIIISDYKMRSTAVPGEYYKFCKRVDGFETSSNCVLIKDMKLLRKRNINNE